MNGLSVRFRSIGLQTPLRKKSNLIRIHKANVFNLLYSCIRGCKPEPPKIPAENVARDVSGHFGYPTRFSMQVLAVKVGRLWSGHASAGKQLFSGLSGGSNLVEQVGMAI